MSKIAELIAELCPEGVPFRQLGDVVERNVGGGTPSRSRSDYWDGDVQWASVGDITATSLTVETTRQQITSAGLANSSSNIIPQGWVVVAVKIAPGAMRVVERDIAINQDIRGLCLTSTVNPYFLAYYFQILNITGNGTIVKGITNKTLMKVEVPVPPLEIQQEIVRILDTFSKMEAELEAELEARKQQYEHYRDAAIQISESQADWLTLYEVAEHFGRGKSKHRPRNDPSLYGGPYPFIQTGDIRNSSHRIISHSQTYSEKGLKQSQLWPVGTICITIAANIAETGILQFEACFPDSIIGMIVDPKVATPGYVEYLLRSRKESLVSKGQGSAQANINLATFREVRFPFPSLEEQNRIVDLLDRFDALVNDLSVGLPAELAARRQQYEYYRDKLLTFKELEPAS